MLFDDKIGTRGIIAYMILILMCDLTLSYRFKGIKLQNYNSFDKIFVLNDYLNDGHQQ